MDNITVFDGENVWGEELTIDLVSTARVKDLYKFITSMGFNSFRKFKEVSETEKITFGKNTKMYIQSKIMIGK